VIVGPNGEFFVPFAPFPAIALMPLVAVTGPLAADELESGINALLAASAVGMGWWLLARIGIVRAWDRIWLVALFGFSTQILWITTRGGVWHTGQLIATLLTLACLIELWGKRRALLIGLLAGAAFLTRAPLAFAVPFYALLLLPGATSAPADIREFARGAFERIPWRSWMWLAAGVLPSIAFFFLYNQMRFDDPLESGYALATLPPWLEEVRQQGLFSLAHVPMNLDYLFLHLPTFDPTEFPFFRPDGLGMSVLLTTPGLLFAVRADWRRPLPWLLLGAAVLVLIPTLLYYGGGWLQYGYRYFLDSIPFIWAICALAAVYRGSVSWPWRAVIAVGLVVMAFAPHWAYRI
jgi:4-amino-4-deoxy-L-arabinose transferase-like glycosyltransferase